MTRRQLFTSVTSRLRGEHLKEDAEESHASQRDSGHSKAKEADAAFGARKWAEAAATYRELVRESPNHAGVRRRLGLCLYRQGQYIQAKVEFQRALRILKEDNASALYLGLCLARMNKPAQAIDAWKQFFDPANITLQRELNLQMGLMEDPEGPSGPAAAEAVEQALSEKPYAV